MPESDVIEFARTQLTLPDKLDPADEMSWQHYLYSKLGKKEVSEEIVEKPSTGNSEKTKTKEQIIEETAERIVAMAKVLYGLHMVWPFDQRCLRDLMSLLQNCSDPYYDSLFIRSFFFNWCTRVFFPHTKLVFRL